MAGGWSLKKALLGSGNDQVLQNLYTAFSWQQLGRGIVVYGRRLQAQSAAPVAGWVQSPDKGKYNY